MTILSAPSTPARRWAGARDLDCHDWGWARRSADERRWLDASYGHK